MMLQIVASLTDDSKGIIDGHNIFMIQATENTLAYCGWPSVVKKIALNAGTGLMFL
jgi:hypothetical protein